MKKWTLGNVKVDRVLQTSSNLVQADIIRPKTWLHKRKKYKFKKVI